RSRLGLAQSRLQRGATRRRAIQARSRHEGERVCHGPSRAAPADGVEAAASDVERFCEPREDVIEHLSVEEWIAFDRARPAPTALARPYWTLALTQAYPQLFADPVRISRAGAKAVVVALVRDRGGAI